MARANTDNCHSEHLWFYPNTPHLSYTGELCSIGGMAHPFSSAVSLGKSGEKSAENGSCCFLHQDPVTPCHSFGARSLNRWPVSLGAPKNASPPALGRGDTFRFSGMALEVMKLRDMELVVRASKKAGAIPSYSSLLLPMASHLADRVRALLVDRAGWARFPDDVSEWLEVQDARSQLPSPDNLLAENFPYGGRDHTALYIFAGWHANQLLGVLITKRMEKRGFLLGGFVANDYALGVWGWKAIDDPAPLLSPDILAEEFSDWVEDFYLLRRAFREVAVIFGLVERQHIGRCGMARKSGCQVTFSTDLLDCAQDGLEHMRLDKVSLLAVPLLIMLRQESVPQGGVDDALVLEAEALASVAMHMGDDE